MLDAMGSRVYTECLGKAPQTRECSSWLLKEFISVQSLSCVLLFVTPWTAARQTSLSITNSQRRHPGKNRKERSLQKKNLMCLEVCKNPGCSWNIKLRRNLVFLVEAETCICRRGSVITLRRYIPVTGSLLLFSLALKVYVPYLVLV